MRNWIMAPKKAVREVEQKVKEIGIAKVAKAVTPNSDKADKPAVATKKARVPGKKATPVTNAQPVSTPVTDNNMQANVNGSEAPAAIANNESPAVAEATA